MFKINRKLEYALIALKHMHGKHPGELTTAKEICDIYKCPFDATARVLQAMTHHGLLRSEQGAHGGYQIQRDLGRVSFLDLVEMVAGSLHFANCLYEDESHCELVPTCNIISPITRLNERLKEFYKGLSLRGLLETPGGTSRVPEAFEQQFVV